MEKCEFEGWIPGIHEQCDRWCDRCPVTAACALYRPGRARREGKSPVALEVERLVRRMSAREPRPGDAGSDETAGPLAWLESDPMMTAAVEALRRTLAWLRVNAERLARTVSDPADRTGGARLAEALEEVGWYASLVPSRLARALLVLREEAIERVIEGSGRGGIAREQALLHMKVALLGIDRLVKAWSLVGPAGSTPEETVTFITQYGDLELACETYLPGSRKLMRPGLDTRAGAPPAGVAKRSRPAPVKDPATEEPPLIGPEGSLFEDLRLLRRERAKDRGVSAFLVFTNRTLREMAIRRPSSLEAMRALHGVGEQKLAEHGAAFLECLREGARAHSLALDA